MCGSATYPMVASSTIISCAVAMMNSATPRWRRLLSVPVWPAVEIVVVMPPMLSNPRLPVVPPANRLRAAGRGYDDRPHYSRGSSRKWVRPADPAEDRLRVGSENAHGTRSSEVLRGRMGHLGRRHGGSVPRLAGAPARGGAAGRGGGADQGGSRPQTGGRGAAADRPRAARLPDPPHLPP